MKALVQMIPIFMNLTTARADACISLLGDLDLLVAYIQPLVQHLGGPDGVVLGEPVLDQVNSFPVNGGHLHIYPCMPFAQVRKHGLRIGDILYPSITFGSDLHIVDLESGLMPILEWSPH